MALSFYCRRCVKQHKECNCEKPSYFGEGLEDEKQDDIQ